MEWNSAIQAVIAVVIKLYAQKATKREFTILLLIELRRMLR